MLAAPSGLLGVHNIVPLNLYPFNYYLCNVHILNTSTGRLEQGTTTIICTVEIVVKSASSRETFKWATPKVVDVNITVLHFTSFQN